MTKIIITGAKGRMGQTLLSCAARLPDIQVVGQIDQGDDLKSIMGLAEVVIDFTLHEATVPIAELCAQHQKAMVIGTTGHSSSDKVRITALANRIPIVWSSNYSTGVNVLFWLTRKAAETLGPSFDLEIVEMHHRMKKDAPSGTASTLGEILAAVRNIDSSKVLQHGRAGLVGERTSTEIGMHSLRGGDVVGDHTVIFAGAGERLELTHRAASRETFAQGALRAALWVRDQKPQLYDMQDVLGLR